MPKCGSWDGKWNGENDLYAITKSFVGEKTKKIFDIIDKNFFYNFGDGWLTKINVKVIDQNEKRKINRLSKGFCGYEWMVNSLIEHGKIIYPE